MEGAVLAVGLPSERSGGGGQSQKGEIAKGGKESGGVARVRTSKVKDF